jgi:hypothetical protein
LKPLLSYSVRTLLSYSVYYCWQKTVNTSVFQKTIITV